MCRSLVLGLVIAAALLGGAGGSVLATCGPFTDVAADAFCPFVLELFTLGITTGTSPTTYDPTSNVNRLQMAAFLSRTVDGALKRGSRRAAMAQFWTSQNDIVLGLTTVGPGPVMAQADGADIWVPHSGTVSRVRASDGRLLETWSVPSGALGVLVAMGRIFLTSNGTPGALSRIDPSQPAGTATTVASNLGDGPQQMAFDGARIWVANFGNLSAIGGVSIVTPGASIPWTVTTVTTGFTGNTGGVLYDGANIWVTFGGSPGFLAKVDATGAILQTVTVGLGPRWPVFDGSNIWVPNRPASSVSVVRASSAVVLATLTGNGLSGNSGSAAFDGQRILVANRDVNTVSLWKAADLTPLGAFSTGAGTLPWTACSDGVNFWIVLNGTNQLARF
jgi:hypothetical protein